MFGAGIALIGAGSHRPRGGSAVYLPQGDASPNCYITANCVLTQLASLVPGDLYSDGWRTHMARKARTATDVGPSVVRGFSQQERRPRRRPPGDA